MYSYFRSNLIVYILRVASFLYPFLEMLLFYSILLKNVPIHSIRNMSKYQ